VQFPAYINNGFLKDEYFIYVQGSAAWAILATLLLTSTCCDAVFELLPGRGLPSSEELAKAYKLLPIIKLVIAPLSLMHAQCFPLPFSRSV
jgi:hypothetical protein